MRLSDGDDSFRQTSANGVEVFALGGADFVGTGDGDDLLSGGEGSDVLRAGGGADTLVGGAGSDSLVGGSGGDLFRFAASDGDTFALDTIADFSDLDRVLLDGFDAQSFDDLVFSASNAGDVIVQVSSVQWIQFKGVTQSADLQGQLFFIE